MNVKTKNYTNQDSQGLQCHANMDSVDCGDNFMCRLINILKFLWVSEP